MEKLFIEVVVDTNDGDYETRLEEITPVDLAEIKPVIEAITEYSKKSSHNFPYGHFVDGISSEELYGEFQGYYLFEEKFIPYPEYGFHTIESVRILTVTNIQKLK